MCRILWATVLGGLLGCAGPSWALEPLASHGGLGTLFNPLQEPGCVRYPACCQDKPCCCRPDRVHVFAVNGVDPLCLGNFNGMCQYLKKQGFHNTYFGQLYTSHGYCKRIREIRACDPDAKIVLIGFSAGCNYVRCMANNLKKDGVRVDLLVYLGGDWIGNRPRSYPENVCQVLNISAHGLLIYGQDLIWKGEDLDGAHNCRLDAKHIVVPAKKETLTLLTEALLELACTPCAPPAVPGVPAVPVVPAAPEGVPVAPPATPYHPQ